MYNVHVTSIIYYVVTYAIYNSIFTCLTYWKRYQTLKMASATTYNYTSILKIFEKYFNVI